MKYIIAGILFCVNVAMGVAPVAAGKVVQIAMGYSNVCALFDSGKAKCWGSNSAGVLGIESTEEIFGITIEQMTNLPFLKIDERIKQISLGYFHACALLENGQVKCWGTNQTMQLGVVKGEKGLGSSIDEMKYLPSLNWEEKAIQVVAGMLATCVVLESGSAKCWGENSFSKLSSKNGDIAFENAAVIRFEQKITNLVMGSGFTCTLLENGKGKCWGHNGFGQLGIGRSEEVVTSEMTTNILIDEKIVQLTATGHHVCALLESGRAKCWGGEGLRLGLGLGVRQVGGTEKEMRNLSNILVRGEIAQISAGLTHTCAVLRSGKLNCWGSNGSGQLGLGIASNEYGKTTEEINEPVVAVAGEKVIQVALRNNSTCALLDSGAVKCWGDNSAGQLGVGDALNRGVEDYGDNSFPKVILQ